MEPEKERQYCLIVHRAGQSTIFPLPKRKIYFGYAPPYADDLVLFDGALPDVQGVIDYYEEPPAKEQTDQNNETGQDDDPQEVAPTNYWLEVMSGRVIYNNGGTLGDGDEPLTAGYGPLQLDIGTQIRVGSKYLLIFSVYQSEAGSYGPHTQHGIALRKEPRIARYTATYPPHLDAYSRHLLPLLPAIFQPDELSYLNGAAKVGVQEKPRNFLDGFLALIESTYLPMRWTIENFDLFLDPDSAPPDFLPFLAQWYGLPIEPPAVPDIDVCRRRQILKRMPHLIARKGTVGGLVELLEVYTGRKPKIIDFVMEASDKESEEKREQQLPANHFIVDFKDGQRPDKWKDKQLKDLIALFQPAHATLQSIQYD